jgi:VIT1/CCC1 family predicted Fe2+/Mn2+ transporter
MDAKMIESLVQFQVNEITESLVYRNLAKLDKNPSNKDVLNHIADEEMKHYNILKKYTGQSPHPNMKKVWRYTQIVRFFGVTFGIKLMEQGEAHAQSSYSNYDQYPDLMQIATEEGVHEKELIDLIDEERLNYMGSVVLGLNDALVELTGALAGFTLALADPKLIALTGSITGVAAALSMASSEYLSTKSEGDGKNALKSALYTGTAYMITVVLLILPFLLLTNIFLSLGITIGTALLIIAVFNYYYSVAKDESFKHRFFEMAALSTAVAGISFLFGYLLNRFIGVS